MVNAMLPFILETKHFLEKYLRLLIQYFFVDVSKSVFCEISIESLVRKSVNKITALPSLKLTLARCPLISSDHWPTDITSVVLIVQTETTSNLARMR